MPTCTHTERFMSVPLCSGQSELASICLFAQFNNQLDVNIKKSYFKGPFNTYRETGPVFGRLRGRKKVMPC